VRRFPHVGQVVVVDQHQLDPGHSDQLGDLGALAGDVDLDAVGTHQLA